MIKNELLHNFKKMWVVKPAFWLIDAEDEYAHIAYPIELIYGPDENGMFCFLKENGVTDRAPGTLIFPTEALAKEYIDQHSEDLS